MAGGVAVAASSGPDAKPATVAGARTPADPNAGIVSQAIGQSPEATKRFWTAARIRAAKPLQTPASNAAPGAVPQANALGAGPVVESDGTLPEGTASAQAGGAASTQAVKTAKQWTKHGKAPARTIGKLFGVDNRGRQYTCSATVINSKNKRTVWTAGHCVHAGAGGSAGFSRYLMFRPDFINGKSQGSWVADRIVALKGWTTKGDLRYDIAAFTVKKYKGKGIQAYTGSQGYSFGYKNRKYYMRSFGYPARALPSKKAMNSNRLWYCSGTTFGVNYGGGSVGLGMWCSMGNGASGGPWIYGMKGNGLGRIAGLNSTHSLRTLQMNSPYHGSAAVSVYKAVSG